MRLLLESSPAASRLTFHKCPPVRGALQRATRQARMDIEGDVWADGEQDAFAEIAALSGACLPRAVLRDASRVAHA